MSFPLAWRAAWCLVMSLVNHVHGLKDRMHLWTVITTVIWLQMYHLAYQYQLAIQFLHHLPPGRVVEVQVVGATASSQIQTIPSLISIDN